MTAGRDLLPVTSSSSLILVSAVLVDDAVNNCLRNDQPDFPIFFCSSTRAVIPTKNGSQW